MRPGIVHRLDRDTSGLLVVARSACVRPARRRTRGARRRAALLRVGVGKLASPRGLIDAPIGRSERRTRMAVRDTGKPARTEYEVRSVYDAPVCSLLGTGSRPGRPIRSGCIRGDQAPRRRRRNYEARESLPLGRPFLHARCRVRPPVARSSCGSGAAARAEAVLARLAGQWRDHNFG
jgi:hypothetical protein